MVVCRVGSCILLIIMVSCQYPGDIPVDSSIIDGVEITDVEERDVKKYTQITEYHWPAELMGKKVVFDETGQGYSFMPDGLFQPTSTVLFPNPIAAEVFTNAIDGSTSEEVEESASGFSYKLDMKGKFDYNGTEYFGGVSVTVARDGESWTLNGKVARVE